MSNKNFQKWLEINNKIEQQSKNSTSLWDVSSREEHENINKVKKQWQKNQQQQFTRIRYQESENQNIKTIIFILTTFTLLAIAIPHMPTALKIIQYNFGKLTSKEKNSPNLMKEDDVLNKVKSLDDENRETNAQNNQESPLKKDNLKKELYQSVDNVQKYKQERQKILNISNDKQVNLEENKIKE